MMERTICFTQSDSNATHWGYSSVREQLTANATDSEILFNQISGHSVAQLS